MSDEEFADVLANGTELQRFVLVVHTLVVILEKFEKLEERVSGLEEREDDWE
jgi:hypothetical protein